MIGLSVALVGLALGIAGWVLLRRSGTAWRVGRLLAAARQRSLEEAVALAARGQEAYVRLHGRIDSDEEFPGDDGQALVFRRRRLQRRMARRTGATLWQTFDDDRLAVPFGLTERGGRVAIDVEALGDGLVVVPRESTGLAAELSAGAARGLLPAMPPETFVRLRLEQVSAVDHGTACGVPRLMASGETVLGPGLGRPLILTTLALDEAMRVLGSEHRTSLRVAAGLLVMAPAVVGAGLLVAMLGR